MSYRGLIDIGKLQRLQDDFCTVTGVLAYCMNENGQQITSLSGTEKEKVRVKDYLSSDVIHDVLDRIEEGSLEDLVIEEIEEVDVRVAALAIRSERSNVCSWLVVQIGLYNSKERFCRVLDLLRNMSLSLFVRKEVNETRNMEFSWKPESKSTGSALSVLDATMQIVRLLDSEEGIDRIIDQWLCAIGQYLKVDTAQIFQLHALDNAMDVICEWRQKGLVSFFDKTSNIPSYAHLQEMKPLTLSLSDSKSEYQEELEKIGVEAVITFPVIRYENGNGMILSLNHREKKHVWSQHELKFTEDAVKVLQSILMKKIQKNNLDDSHLTLKTILDNVGCYVYVMDKNTQEMLFANRKLQNIFAKELQDKTFQELINRGVTKDQESGAFEFFHIDMDCWFDLTYKEISWMDGKTAILYSLYEITDKKLYQRKIEQQANTDFLTGLYNRMCCERDLAKQIDEARKNGETGALLYMDLDDFKHINDGLGHQYGDVLLRAISHALKNIKGIENSCYRMGGDEFVIVIPPKYYAEFDRIVEQIQQIFSKPWYLKDADYYCTMSMGVAIFPDNGDTVTDLIKKADLALYEAKKSGKNRLTLYKDGIDSVSGRRLSMEKNMRDATVGGYEEFEVFFQPIINVENGSRTCAGAEALLRWNSRKFGFIPPGEFIPLAEYLGLINPIGNYVLREACTHCKKWNDNGHPDYKVNVNLSVVQLLQPDIVELVENTLKETGANPANLTLEVTESLAINDMERMKEILGKIKALGVKIALDDFGTGYSSLNHIREIPLDVIKVDRSFVKELADDPYSQSFIKMIAELGESIGVSICVEGVETYEQHKVLQGMKVKYIQGYYFDRPLPHDKFEAKYVC